MMTQSTKQSDSPPQWLAAIEWLRCPRTGAKLKADGRQLVSCDESTRLAYPVKENIPALLPEHGVELSIEEWITLPAPQTIPLIISIDNQSFQKHQNNIISKKNKIAYLLVKESEPTGFINKASENFSILLEIESKIDVASILENLPLKGIALNGSQELKPGLKDYDNLSEILEKLEVE